LELIKFTFSTIVSLISAGGFWYFWQNKSENLLKFTTIIGLFGKFFGVLIIYTFFPSVNQNSDATLYYLPQVKEVISGSIPYIDFKTSYSILFHYFISPFVYLWPSVGAIVLMMVIIENSMIGLYLWRGNKKSDLLRWYVVFLYTFNPISIYWTLAGYNSIIIGFIAIVAIVFAEYHKDFLAGISVAVGFLISKFLLVLTWPAIIFYRRQDWIKRTIPLLILIILLIFLLAIGIDIFQPLRFESGRSTSGNLWFIILAVFPEISETNFWNLLPIVIFGIIFIPLFTRFIKINRRYPYDSFNITLTFVSITFLLFMIISKKTYPFYFQMILLFLIHTLIRSKDSIKLSFVLIGFLGSVTTLEPYLFQVSGYSLKPNFNNHYYVILLGLDFLIILSYLILMRICYKQMIQLTNYTVNAYSFT
jgi:hypothetical protein